MFKSVSRTIEGMRMEMRIDWFKRKDQTCMEVKFLIVISFLYKPLICV